MKFAESAADVPVVILAGGDLVDLQGRVQPKACIRVADRPMLAHVIDQYSKHGFRRFLVCTGNGHEQVARDAQAIAYPNGGAHVCAVSVDLVFTGDSAGTARRLRDALRLIPDARTVAVSYVDIISNVDITAVRATHEAEAVAATLTAVNLPTRFKQLGVNLFSARVRGLATKPITEDTLVSGGFYFINRERFAAAAVGWENHESFEQETLPRLASAAALVYHKHEGYWQAIDGSRDVHVAERQFYKRLS